MNKNYTRASHGFGPVYDEKSRILILGSFPSVKSREEGFFYGHPRNRFWKILAAVCDAPEPVTIEETISFGTWHCVVRCHRRMRDRGFKRQQYPEYCSGESESDS